MQHQEDLLRLSRSLACFCDSELTQNYKNMLVQLIICTYYSYTLNKTV